jgi:hypothetical protein
MVRGAAILLLSHLPHSIEVIPRVELDQHPLPQRWQPGKFVRCLVSSRVSPPNSSELIHTATCAFTHGHRTRRPVENCEDVVGRGPGSSPDDGSPLSQKRKLSGHLHEVLEVSLVQGLKRGTLTHVHLSLRSQVGESEGQMKHHERRFLAGLDIIEVESRLVPEW